MYICTKGNKKLKNTKNTRFLIWSLPAQKTCPYATEHCKASCYAKKAERCYPNCLPARVSNLLDSMKADFAEKMIDYIGSYLKRPTAKKAEHIYFRIHESGDFYSREYLLKWVQIANYFSSEKRLVFMAYTKSISYFIGVQLPKNFIIRFSVWDDTHPAQLALAEMLHFPIYTATADISGLSKKEICPCNDCATCKKCYKKNSSKILTCKIH